MLPYRLLMLMFISSYFIMGIARYIPIPSIGMTADALLIITFISLLFARKKYDWTNCRNDFMVVSLIWLLYCTMQLLNPRASLQAWFTYVRFMAFYGFLISILVPIILNRYEDLRKIVFLWSVFILLAVLKALLQKQMGFDYAEKHWLFVEGKASTHLLSTGIRYFSFFTDAANFGSGMGMSMVVFLIIGLHQKHLKNKLYYTLVGLAAGLAMMISGTRSAMIIPFVGFAFYIFFSKNIKVILLGTVMVGLVFVFFNFTQIGQGNAQIRRMRSAFNSKQDNSYNLRLENQAKIGAYLDDKPFGVGVGLGGGKAAKSAPGEYATTIATDSWKVVLWVETGIVGLCLYIALFLYLQLRGAYLVFFEVKDDELRSLLGALLAGIFGLVVSSWNNEVVAQFPNGIIVFFAQAFIMMALKFDKQIAEKKLLTQNTQ